MIKTQLLGREALISLKHLTNSSNSNNNKQKHKQEI